MHSSSKQLHKNPIQVFYHNALSALVVSFVAISLGASFGVMSGRGALSGMLSAGLIAFVTALLGGTRIQCSGPTAPMSTVAAAVIVSTAALSGAELGGLSANQLFNFVVILSGLMLIITALFRGGNLIRWIPHSVVSGFMSGIAVLIWLDQIKRLFYLDGAWQLTETQMLNVIVALLTLGIIVGLPRIKEHHVHNVIWRILPFCPPTLIAIVFSTFIVHLAGVPIATIDIDVSAFSGSVGDWLGAQLPTTMSWQLLWFSLPLAFELALLCYLDTLMTALVMDRLTREKTQRNRELVAQGVANGAVALIGGIPGAQATIRSVLILKEGATSRFAGMLVGVFVIVELLIFLDWLRLIPKAVFIGILFKVGYDVFDWTIVRALRKKLKGQATPLSMLDLPLIVLTILVTVFYNLSAAAIGATVVFYVVQKLTQNALPDLAGIATEAKADDKPALTQ